MSKSSTRSAAAKVGANHIQLTPEQKRAIEEAVDSGVVSSVDEFIERALAILSDPKDHPRPRLSATEWARQFEEWADSFPDAPPIPDEALSRKNLYPDRW